MNNCNCRHYGECDGSCTHETEAQYKWRTRDRRSVVRQEREETYKGGHKFEAWDEASDGAWKEKDAKVIRRGR